jgi:hypothetical protein
MQEGTTPGKEEVELRQEQQPRATQGAVAEVEPRREQRSRTCESGHPWRSDGGGSTHAQL